MQAAACYLSILMLKIAIYFVVWLCGQEYEHSTMQTAFHLILMTTYDTLSTWCGRACPVGFDLETVYSKSHNDA